MTNEIDLIKAAQAGSQKAFAILFQKYRNVLYRSLTFRLRGTGLESRAEDILLEGFAKSFHNIQKFKPEFTFGSWLGRICTNQMIDTIRKRKLDTISLDQNYFDDEGNKSRIDVTSSDMDPLQESFNDQLKEITAEAMDALPDNMKVIMKMRYMDELSYDEIVEEMGMPLGTVKASLFRGRNMMTKILKSKNISKEIYSA